MPFFLTVAAAAMLFGLISGASSMLSRFLLSVYFRGKQKPSK